MFTDRRRFLRGVASAALGRQLAAQGKPVVCRVTDVHSGRAVPARVRLLDARGNEVVPVGHPASLAPDAQEGDVRFQSRRFAYVDGEFQIDPAALPLKYQVIKGYEYGIAEGEITEAAIRDGSYAIPLSRWSSLGDRGWYSGDIHIHHIAPKTCRLEMDAEDLNVANILTSDFTTDQDEFEGRVNANSSGKHLIYVNQEFRNDHLGHMCLLNLKRLIEPVKPMQQYHYPLHTGPCDRTREQGGYVSWAHFPSWPGVENPLDVALEKLDGLEILSVLEPRALPVFMKQVVPEIESNHGLRLWYRYLNCGFRLTATAGTDKMTTFVTVGANRVFAKIEGDFTYQAWIDALKAGRTFVTNSPVLAFTVNGREAGATLAMTSGKDRVLRIHAKAESQVPYDRLQIVANGNVIGEAVPSGIRHKAEIHLEHPLRGSCWIAARAFEDLDRYRGVDFQKIHVDQGTLLSSLYGTRRPEAVFAHSSPVYVVVDGKPIRNRDDAEYYIRYLDNSIRWLKTDARFASAADRQASIETFERGRAVYKKLASEAPPPVA
ncbi:MAG: CehA/McbA family metallohydrolase [Bryobacteraceae bacterium]|nr:CehA/McbA family metallohydrolase [Bryobacteraceae bacterium]